MGNLRSSGLTYLMILLVTMIIVFAAASVITGETTNSTTTESDYEQILDDVLDDISTYIQVKDQKGKFYKINDEYKIQKIAVLISPLITKEIDLSKLTIQIDNGELVNILYYQNGVDIISSNSLFEHSIWNNLNGSNFSLISINDLDKSIVNFDTFNKNSDMAYLVFKLPDSFAMKKYDTIKLTMFPDSGITRTIILEAPMPITSVITFE